MSTSWFDPFPELDRLAGALMHGRSYQAGGFPADLTRDGDTFTLRLDLPGVDPASIEVKVDGQMLSVSAERPPIDAPGATWLVRERAYGKFSRQMAMGRDIDAEKISAMYSHGVLTVTIPLAEKSKARTVPVISVEDATKELAE